MSAANLIAMYAAELLIIALETENSAPAIVPPVDNGPGIAI